MTVLPQTQPLQLFDDRAIPYRERTDGQSALPYSPLRLARSGKGMKGDSGDMSLDRMSHSAEKKAAGRRPISKIMRNR